MPARKNRQTVENTHREITGGCSTPLLPEVLFIKHFSLSCTRKGSRRGRGQREEGRGKYSISHQLYQGKGMVGKQNSWLQIIPSQTSAIEQQKGVTHGDQQNKKPAHSRKTRRGKEDEEALLVGQTTEETAKHTPPLSESNRSSWRFEESILRERRRGSVWEKTMALKTPTRK